MNLFNVAYFVVFSQIVKIICKSCNNSFTTLISKTTLFNILDKMLYLIIFVYYYDIQYKDKYYVGLIDTSRFLTFNTFFLIQVTFLNFQVTIRYLFKFLQKVLVSVYYNFIRGGQYKILFLVKFQIYFFITFFILFFILTNFQIV